MTMATFKVSLTKKATSQLDRIERGDKRVYEQLIKALKGLREDPYGPNTGPLKGTDSDRRVRVGGYRILYTIDQEQVLVEVVRIGPRGDIYK